MTVVWTRERRFAVGIGAFAILVVAVLVARRLRGSGGEESEVQTDVAVHVSPVTRATLHRYVTAYGYVEAQPAVGGRPPAGALLSPIVGGVLASIECVEGQHVSQGTVLFRLDSRLAEVAVQKARQEVDFADKAFKRQQELLPSNGTSQRAFQEAQQQLDAARSDLSAAETQLAYLQITTPLTGTVVRVRAEVGQAVDPSTVLAEVVNLDRLVVSARVPSRDVGGLKAGQRVFIGSDTVPTGVVTIVGKDVDPNTGTYLVQTVVPAGAPYRPGQFTEVRIVADEHADVLVVPEVSLVTRAGEGTWIMVVTGDSAVRHVVTAGLHDRGLVEVSGDGIAEGMTVVTDDAYSLPEETKIRIIGG
jgi:membrane fusion protein, multidrug efflux system